MDFNRGAFFFWFVLFTKELISNVFMNLANSISFGRAKENEQLNRIYIKRKTYVMCRFVPVGNKDQALYPRSGNLKNLYLVLSRYSACSNVVNNYEESFN